MPMTPLKELGQKLKAARKKKGLTQQQLADISHVSLKHIQNCERGEKNPSFEILRALVQVLDISLDSLIAPNTLDDEQAANEMRQIYLSCPPVARKTLLNSTRALANELKDMIQTADPVADTGSEN